MAIALKIFEAFVMMIGCCTLAVLMRFAIESLVDKITQIMHRQSKIRCLCKHEYELHWNFYYGRDLDEYCFVCRKCKKVLKIKVAEKVGCE